MNFRPVKTAFQMLAFSAILYASSCKKENGSGSSDTSAASLSDSSTAADNSYYDVINTAVVSTNDNASVWNSKSARAVKNETFSKETITGANLGCAVYSFDDATPGEYPKTLTLDFGAGCTSADGILRKGKIMYLFVNGPLFSPQDTIITTFNNYSVNGYGIQGQYMITDNSSETGISFKTQVTNGIVTYPGGNNFHYSHNKTYTLTAGLNTPFDLTDDVYSITGNSSFSNAAGNSIVFTTKTPLVRALSCHNVGSGIVDFVYNQSIDGTIDFGDGTCDNLATVKVGTYSKTIILW